MFQSALDQFQCSLEHYALRGKHMKKLSECPKEVRDCAETIGGYLGVECATFDLDGHNAKYFVVGNYYGSAVFIIDGDIHQVEDDT
jgi:hypothetical protein